MVRSWQPTTRQTLAGSRILGSRRGRRRRGSPARRSGYLPSVLNLAGFRTLPLLGLLLLMSGCGPSTSPTLSVQPSASPSESAVSNLPPGCEPIDLRGLDGQRIVLDGQWIEVDRVGEPMIWWIRTQGDCVWGNGQVEDVETLGPHQVQGLSGVIGSDFVITGDILWLGPYDRGLTPYSPLRMLIEFAAEGEIFLREDRGPTVQGPRCPDPPNYCPAPLVLERAD